MTYVTNNPDRLLISIDSYTTLRMIFDGFPIIGEICETQKNKTILSTENPQINPNKIGSVNGLYSNFNCQINGNYHIRCPRI